MQEGARAKHVTPAVAMVAVTMCVSLGWRADLRDCIQQTRESKLSNKPQREVDPHRCLSAYVANITAASINLYWNKSGPVCAQDAHLC